VEVLATLDVGASAIVLRRAGPGDLPAIVGLLAADQLGAARDGIRDEADRRAYRRAFAEIDRDPAHVLVVAEAGDRVVATMQLSFLPGLARPGVSGPGLDRACSGRFDGALIRFPARGRDVTGGTGGICGTGALPGTPAGRRRDPSGRHRAFLTYSR
jgi:hypothetical protein